MFKPFNTSDESVTGAQKTLLYADAGWGKTTQFAHMQREYGKTFIISGESGLRSVKDAGIDYLPFQSWDGEHDPDNGKYSFKGLMAMVESLEFRLAGYKCIGIDSATELSDRLWEHIAEKHKDNKNGFEKYGDFNTELLLAMKWIRDLPYHVLVTCLVRKGDDGDGSPDYWPNVKGQTARQLPGLFDNVFAGVRISSMQQMPDGRVVTQTERLIHTDEVGGWHAKARDPNRRLKPTMRTGDITKLFKLMDMSEDEYKNLMANRSAETKE